MDSVALSVMRDERDIERALNLFARAMDNRDWATMAAILAEDVEGDFGTGRLVGATAIIDMIRGFLGSCGPTQHLLGTSSSMSWATPPRARLTSATST